MKNNDLRISNFVEKYKNEPILSIEFNHPFLVSGKPWNFSRTNINNKPIWIVQVETSTIKGANLYIKVGDIKRNAIDARIEMASFLVPPKQEFGGIVIPDKDTPSGIIIFYGWEMK